MEVTSTWYGRERWRGATTEQLAEEALSNFDDKDRAAAVAKMLGRLLDSLPLTDQQRVDIIEPYRWTVSK